MAGPAGGTATDRSFKARRAGWRAVGGALVGFTFSYATLGVLVLSLLTEPLMEAFGWQRSSISLALLVFVTAAVGCSWPLGVLMDRDGVRRFLLPSLALFGVVLWSLSLLTSSVVHLCVAYLLLGIFASATLPNSYTRVVIGWFDKDRGLALGIAAAGAAIGMVVLPPGLTAILLEFGWRQVYLVSALMVLLLCLPAVALLLKENPESRAVATERLAAEAAHALRQAFRTRSFVLLGAAFVLLGLVTIGLVPHIVPMLLDIGEQPMAAARTLSAYGLAAVIGRVGCGYCLDRFFAPHVAIVAAAGPALACVLLALGPSPATGLVAATLVGVGAGAELDLMAYMISRYLGLRAFSQLYALMFGAFYVAGGLGNVALGYQFDLTASYAPALWSMVVLAVIAIVLLTRLGPYPQVHAARGGRP